MNLLLTLLIAHLFADFPLQTNALAKLKEAHWSGVFLHVLVHMVVMTLLIDQRDQYWPLILGIGVIHFIIDAIKLLYPGAKGVAYFLLDQIVHVGALWLAATWAQRIWQPAPLGILPDAWLLPILVAALIPAFMVLLWLWANSLNQEYTTRYYLLDWAKHQMLAVEQRIGLLLFAFVFLQPALHALPQLIRGIWR
jgi:hypothetical protein